MRTAGYFGFALFILVTFGVQVDSYFKKYITAVSDVHEHYRTSSVLFVLSGNERSIKNDVSVYSLSRDLSRQYDLTSIIHVDELDKWTSRYRNRISGPTLLVIFLRSLNDIAEFPEKIPSKSYIWLVIFTNESGGSALCEYCESPTGNNFRLRFDTEMLVLCCDSLILKEWWSVDGHRTEVSDFASWTDDNRDKLTFLAPKSLDSRRYDVKGAGIRVGIVQDSVAAYEVGDEIRGLFGDILAELKRSINFTITRTVRSPQYGRLNSTTKNWTGIVGEVIRGEADLGIAGFTITKERLQVLEYTIPLMTSKYRLYIREPQDSAGVHWTGYLQVFSGNVWLLLSVVLILAPILLAVIKLIRSSTSLPFLIGESYMYVWGILCQQGLHEFPARTSLRIAYFSVFISALIIYAAYTAALISFLAVSSSKLPFETLVGFVEDGSYRLIVIRGNAEFDFFRNSENPIIQRMMKMMKPEEELPTSTAAGWNQVCEERVAFYHSYLPKTRCKVAAIDSGYEDILGMIMTAGNQYRNVINYHLQRFKDTGVMDKMNKKHYNTTNTSREAKFGEIHLWDVAPVLATLAIGIISAMLLLLAEVLYCALKTNLRIRRSRKKFQAFRTIRRTNKRLLIPVQWPDNRLP